MFLTRKDNQKHFKIIQKSTDNHSSFDGIIQESIDQYDIYEAVINITFNHKQYLE